MSEPEPDQHVKWRALLGAAYVIFGAWIVMTVIYYGLEYWVWTYPGVVPWWLEATRGFFENLQSEAWQVGFAAWVFKHFLWDGTPESK